MDLVDVAEIRPIAERVVAQFALDLRDLLGDVDVHHIGATALPFGHTKADVDVNVRVEPDRARQVAAALRERFEVAQPENWTPTFASFSADGYLLPLGIQVTAIGSESDFLLELRERMRADPELLRRYDAVKRTAAPEGAEAYWEAKDAFLRELLAGRPSLP